MQDKVYLTQEGYEKLKEELKFLTGTRRRELSDEIGKARALGDLKENAEYHAAREAQGLCEKRIAEIQDKLASAQILDDSQMSKDEVLIGATVKLKDMDTDEEITYMLVSEIEADFSNNKISVSSPVGQGLLGHKVNDEVLIKVPAGVLKYKIISIARG